MFQLFGCIRVDIPRHKSLSVRNEVNEGYESWKKILPSYLFYLEIYLKRLGKTEDVLTSIISKRRSYFFEETDFRQF